MSTSTPKLKGLSPSGTIDLNPSHIWSSPLQEAPSTGFLWSASLDGNFADVKLVRPSAQEQSDSDVAGNDHLIIGGYSPITVEVVGKRSGEGVLRLVLQRPWLPFDEDATRWDIPVRVTDTE